MGLQIPETVQCFALGQVERKLKPKGEKCSRKCREFGRKWELWQNGEGVGQLLMGDSSGKQRLINDFRFCHIFCFLDQLQRGFCCKSSIWVYPNKRCLPRHGSVVSASFFLSKAMGQVPRSSPLPGRSTGSWPRDPWLRPAWRARRVVSRSYFFFFSWFGFPGFGFPLGWVSLGLVFPRFGFFQQFFWFLGTKGSNLDCDSHKSPLHCMSKTQAIPGP